MENQKNPMMDERVVRMNEIIATKLSSVSKSRRESLKENKVAAKFILENWDDAESLIMLTFNPDMKVKCYELYCIAKSRVDQLTPKPEVAKQPSEEELIEKIEGGDHPILNVDGDNKVVTFSHNDNANEFTLKRMSYWLHEGYKLIIGSWCTGSTRVQMVVYHTASDLQKLMGDEIEIAYKGGDRYPEAVVTLKNDEETLETLKVVNNTPEKKNVRSKNIKRQVGDIHPNGKWVWVEYRPGKFDWKSLKGWKWGKNGRTPAPESGNIAEVESKTNSKSSSQSEDKKARKSTESKKKVRSIEEILSNKPQGLSEPQERLFELFRKGYRINFNVRATIVLDIDDVSTSNGGYTLVKDNKITTVMEAVFNALISRLNVSEEEMKQFKA